MAKNRNAKIAHPVWGVPPVARRNTIPIKGEARLELWDGNRCGYWEHLHKGDKVIIHRAKKGRR